MIFILILRCTGCAKHTIHTTNILVKYDWILSRAIKKKRERRGCFSAGILRVGKTMDGRDLRSVHVGGPETARGGLNPPGRRIARAPRDS